MRQQSRVAGILAKLKTWCCPVGTREVGLSSAPAGRMKRSNRHVDFPVIAGKLPEYASVNG
jgi:hypothetical protein